MLGSFVPVFAKSVAADENGAQGDAVRESAAVYLCPVLPPCKYDDSQSLNIPLLTSAPSVPHSAGAGEGSKAVLDIQGLWHPCAISRVAGDTVVPNDLVLGSQQQNG